MNEFRLLRADEIECRIASINEKGLTLLLYKDARVDQNLLDETFGMFNWQRNHQVIDGNLYCTVSIWDENKSQWISKQDVGTESYTEKEKGQASDSFKRACFNFGIGRELYTAPFIWVSKDDCNITSDKKCYDKFKVTEIGYNDKREINALVIINTKTKKEVFRLGSTKQVGKDISKEPIGKTKAKALETKCKNDNIPVDMLLKAYKVDSLDKLTEAQFMNANANWEKIKAKASA